MDEILDSITDKKQLDSLIERLCMDYPEKLSALLNEFFNHKSDANEYLEAFEQEEVESQFCDYITNRWKL